MALVIECPHCSSTKLQCVTNVLVCTECGKLWGDTDSPPPLFKDDLADLAVPGKETQG